jgi:protein Jumonji
MCFLSLFVQIGGMEVDLPRLYKIVQSFGGLKEVIEKKKWHRVADGMKIPKSAQDRVTKLDDIYCKYLLPYDTLSPGENMLNKGNGNVRNNK